MSNGCRGVKSISIISQYMQSYWFSKQSKINIIYNISVITITITMSIILENFGKYAISDCPFILCVRQFYKFIIMWWRHKATEISVFRIPMLTLSCDRHRYFWGRRSIYDFLVFCVRIQCLSRVMHTVQGFFSVLLYLVLVTHCGVGTP